MPETKDIISGIIGGLIFLTGFVWLLEVLKIVNIGFSNLIKVNWFTASLPYLISILGIYLLIESVIELANSHFLGWLSVIIGAAAIICGILLTLKTFNIGPGLWNYAFAYQMIFILEGIFLIIAAFAMEP